MNGEDRTLLCELATAQGIKAHSKFSEAYRAAASDLTRRGADVAPAPTQRHLTRLLKVGAVKTEPFAPTVRVLEYMFQRPIAELLGPAPMPQSPPVDAVSQTRAPNESELLMTAQDAAVHAGQAASLHLDEMSLDQLDDDLVVLARSYGMTAPSQTYERAKILLQAAQSMLERTSSPQQHTRLYYAAAQATALLSAVSFDLGAMAPAVSLARSSAQYGKTIENGPVQAYAHGMLAFMAFWEGRPTGAVRLARQALEFGGLGDTARRRLLAIEARAHGHLRNDREAQRAIRQAGEQAAGDRDELHDDIGGEFDFDLARTAMSNATTSLLLRDGEAAEASATEALALLSNRPENEQPIVVSGPAAIDLARARLMRREVEGASEALASVLQIPPEWRGAGLLERLTAARIELTSPAFERAPAAVDLAERIEEFSALSPARRLGAVSPLAIEA
ncbi:MULTISPECIES: hypothetical protein [Streptomyces]|uniref:Tetratricopeptide repeat protein n=1 Tax=Streptomyces reniochalinae TaxID=2250578 RepID=A0A367EA68_9ACTN|nr:MULTISPECIES: hypothetical protein [Streptomyces]RCG14893.1 hypothetical protein DQ392_27860 [Streptomyces reniochalinae]